MRGRTLLAVALSCAVVAVAARADKRAVDVPVQNPPALPPVLKVEKTAAAADPTEPQLQVELSHGAAVARPGAGNKAEVTSNPKGTTIKVPSQGSYSGTATLTFKNCAPPMRFTTQLTGVPNYDLSGLSLASGSVTLQVGSVGTSTTTRYFDAKGQEQNTSVGAAYTVRARRGDNGVVDVELRRGAGAALGKTMSVTWQSNINNLKIRLRGG